MMPKYDVDTVGSTDTRHAMNMAGTQNLHIKSDISDAIWADALLVLKYPGIIGPIKIVSGFSSTKEKGLVSLSIG